MKGFKVKNSIFIIIILSLSIAFLSVLFLFINTPINTYIPNLKVEGDVSRAFVIKNIKDFKTCTVKFNGKKLTCIKLDDIVKKSEPAFEKGSILIVGEDGFTSEISSQKLGGCFISFSKENGWEAVNLNYPPSTNVKGIKSLLLVSKDENVGNGVGIITPEANVASLTVGSILAGSFISYPYFEGRSFVTKNNVENSSDIYTRHTVVKLKDLIDIKNGDEVLVTGKNGSCTKVDGGGYLEVKNNAINYTLFDKENEVKNIAGIIINPPLKSVTNVYKDSINNIESGKNVMVIYLDGFGNHQYQYAAENGYIPFIKTLSNVSPAWTVYTPVTNAGFAAMLTGKTPDKNGVHSRKERNMNVPTIFDALKKMGKKALLIEGNIKILNTNVTTILNVDKNNDKTTDDEVFKTAEENLSKKYNFILVHFHGIDDMGHKYGDFNEKTMNKVKEVDEYVRKLSEAWNGSIIITADHGMHTTSSGGDHGSFLYQDMIVPYIISKGGK